MVRKIFTLNNLFFPIVIKTYNMENRAPKIDKLEKNNDLLVVEKLKIFSEKDKEKNLEKIRHMMIDSAMEQARNNSAENSEELRNNQEKSNANVNGENMEFFDF